MKVELHSGQEILKAQLQIGKKDDGFLICHGFGGSIYEPEESSVAADLAARNYTTMIVSHKTGGRFDLIFQDQVRQLIDAVTYMLKEIHMKRVHLFGISMGASNALVASAMDGRIASAASSSGIMDCEIWLKGLLKRDFERFVSDLAAYEVSLLKGERKSSPLFKVADLLEGGRDATKSRTKIRGRTTKVSVRTIRSMLTYKPIISARGISGKPVYFFHGTNDQLVPHSHTLEMYKAVRARKRKILIRGGGHEMILDESIRRRITTSYLRWLREDNLLEE